MADKVGKPTKYKPEYCEQGYKLCLLGAIDVEMADFFGVAESTLHLWKLKHPEFKEALDRGKMIADANVASRLYQNAMGYSHPDTKVLVVNGEVQEVEITRHYPPNARSIEYFLNNRQRAKWNRQPTETEEQQESIQKVQIEVVNANQSNSDEASS